MIGVASDINEKSVPVVKTPWGRTKFVAETASALDVTGEVCTPNRTLEFAEFCNTAM